MSYQEVMDMPIRTFWFMNNTINRIRADEEIRTLSLHAHVASGEGQKHWRELLVSEMGEVILESPMAAVRDEEGFNMLRELSKLQ